MGLLLLRHLRHLHQAHRQLQQKPQRQVPHLECLYRRLVQLRLLQWLRRKVTMMPPLLTLLLRRMRLLLKGLHRMPDQTLVAGAAMETLAAVVTVGVAMVGVVVMVVGATEAVGMAAVGAMEAAAVVTVAAVVVKNVVGL